MEISIDDNESFDGIGTAFFEPLRCSQNLESMFCTVNEDTYFPTTVKMNERRTLKGLVDDAYWKADDIGVEGVQNIGV